MTRSIIRLRLLILCLALISFSIGLVLKEQLYFPDNLTVTLVSEAVVVVLYIEFSYSAKTEHFRGWRIFLRFALGFLTIYGPVKILDACRYSVERNYESQSPGFDSYERIHCEDGDTRDRYDWDSIKFLSVFRLFRARCIITLTVAALICVELFCYARSDEGSGLSRDDAMAETRNDVELANTSVGEPQKIMVADPPNGA